MNFRINIVKLLKSYYVVIENFISIIFIFMNIYKLIGGINLIVFIV